MPSFDVEVKFEIYCARCGAGICMNGETSSTKRGLRLDMEPCERCLEKEAEEAEDKVRRELEARIAELERELRG